MWSPVEEDCRAVCEDEIQETGGESCPKVLGTGEEEEPDVVKEGIVTQYQ